MPARLCRSCTCADPICRRWQIGRDAPHGGLAKVLLSFPPAKNPAQLPLKINRPSEARSLKSKRPHQLVVLLLAPFTDDGPRIAPDAPRDLAIQKESPAEAGLRSSTGAALGEASAERRTRSDARPWTRTCCDNQTPMAQRSFPMTIIDSQVHVYEANTPKRPWHSVPNSPDHVTGDEMVAAMDKVGVEGAIFISAFSMYQYDASYAVEVQQAHPGRFAIVKPVDPDDPAVADIIADWKKTRGAVGIRIMLTKEANRAPDDPGLDRIARAAARHDFPVNVLFWGNVDAGAALIDRHPDTRFIIDHLAILQPRVPPAPPQPWADLPKVVELAKRPNAVIKVSGACTLSREPYPFPDMWDPLARLFDAWGFDRCLWGTDWTRAFAVVNYEQAVEPFRRTDRLSEAERAMLMGGACAKSYGWSPRKG